MSGEGPDTTAGGRTGLVVSASRRHVMISESFGPPLKGMAASRALDITVGDLVSFEQRGDEVFVTSVRPRKNCIARSYRGEKRDLVANLDSVWVITAVPPLFNNHFVDHLLTVAHSEDIPTALIVNKIDLGIDDAIPDIELYQSLDIPVIPVSAKHGTGLSELTERLEDPSLSCVALVGVSGVGKSTVINKLVPSAAQTTNEVSRKTGQGRQTTTQPVGFIYPRKLSQDLLVVDLPGVQNFGVAHLTRQQVLAAFIEFRPYEKYCRYSDCAHIGEDECGVKAAVEDDQIAFSRYDSYARMCAEIEEAKPY